MLPLLPLSLLFVCPGRSGFWTGLWRSGLWHGTVTSRCFSTNTFPTWETAHPQRKETLRTSDTENNSNNNNRDGSARRFFRSIMNLFVGKDLVLYNLSQAETYYLYTDALAIYLGNRAVSMWRLSRDRNAAMCLSSLRAVHLSPLCACVDWRGWWGSLGAFSHYLPKMSPLHKF